MARLTFDKAPTHYGKKSNSGTNSKITGIAHMVLSSLSDYLLCSLYKNPFQARGRKQLGMSLVMARLTLRRLLLS